MACLDKSELWDATDKVYKQWSESETLKRWGFTDDVGVFKRLFEASTGKLMLAGESLNHKDMAKMSIAIKDLEKDLRTPKGALTNVILRNLYVGPAKAMRNPITKEFRETLINANEYRLSHTKEMMSNYTDLIKSLKNALIEFDGSDTFSKKRLSKQKFDKLNDLEKAYTKKLKNDEAIGAGNEWGILRHFLDNEGAVFEDFINRVEEGSNAGLLNKYRSDIGNRRPYINRIERAANEWDAIQQESKGHLIKSLDNLSEIINLKYGKASKTAEFLINEYKEVADKLKKHEGGYVPHYVLDILGQSIEISDKMIKSKSNTERDSILREYTDKTKEINTNLLQRLKERATKPSEYFSRNPMLYAQKYVEQVVQFNHNSFVDLAYIKGLQKLTETAFRNEGTKEGNAAKVYQKIFNDFYNTATNKDNRIDTGTTASNITRLLTSIQFISKLGLSTRGALRNATQRFLNFSQFGPKMQYDAIRAYKGSEQYRIDMNKELTKHGLQFQDISKVTEGAVTSADLAAHGIDLNKGILTFRDKNTILEKITQAGAKTAEFSSALTQWAENWNRKGTFKVAFHKRVEQLKLTDRYSNWFQNEAIKQEMYANAGNFGAKMVSLLHFEYSKFDKAGVLQSKPGAILGQFQHYALSFANLQTQMVKDYIRAFKAGDYTGEELGRLVRLGSIYAMAELASGFFDVNFTSYINNDTLDRAAELVRFLTGDEEEKKEAFYGKGLVGAVGLVPVSDLVELHNLGAAAGYWNMLADEESTAGWLAGMREYKSIDNTEFAKEAAGMLSIELDRIASSTFPARNYSNPLWSMIRAELGLYPGTTSFGIDTRAMRKKFVGDKGKKKVPRKALDYSRTPFENLSKKQKDNAIKSLRNF
jgi:hypothetical protein